MPDIYDVADDLEPTIRRVFLEAVAETKRHVPQQEIELAFADGDISRVVGIMERVVSDHLVPWLGRLRDALVKVFEDSGSLAAVLLPFGIQAVFDAFNPRVPGWIERNVGTRIEEFAEGTVDTVRAVVHEGWTEGITVPNQARMIRPMVGLTENQGRTVGRYIKETAKQVGEEAAIRNGELYANRLLIWRGDVIARTENIEAANAGRYELWRQMAQDRILQVHRTFVEWLVKDDDRLCKFCAPMERQVVPFGQPFVSRYIGFPDGELRKPPERQLRPDPFGQPRDQFGRFTVRKQAEGLRRRGTDITVLHPPLHPQCRCDIRLLFDAEPISPEEATELVAAAARGETTGTPQT